MKIFAKRLKFLREKSELSQKEVAQKIHSTEASIYNYENGTRTPSIDTLKELSDCFGVTADYLIGRSKFPVANMNLEKVCDYSGLSPYALKILHQFRQNALPKILNIILYDKMAIEFLNYCEHINGCAAFEQNIRYHKHKFNQLSHTEINENNQAKVQNQRKVLLSNVEDLDRLKTYHEYKAQQFTSTLLKCVYGLPADEYIPKPSKTYAMAMEIIKCDEKFGKINPDFPNGGFIGAIDLYLENHGDEDGNDNKEE